MSQLKNTHQENEEDSYQWVRKVTAHIMRRCNMSPANLDDYQSAAFIGLMEAKKKHDPAKGNLLQFAAPRVRGAVIDEMRARSNMSVAAYRELRKMREREAGQSDTEIKNGGYGVLAYQVDSTSGFDSYLYTTETPAELYEKKVSYKQLNAFIEKLPQDEQDVLKEHYFEEKSLTHIALERGTDSRSWASRLHLKALHSLRQEYARAKRLEERTCVRKAS